MFFVDGDIDNPHAAGYHSDALTYTQHGPLSCNVCLKLLNNKSLCNAYINSEFCCLSKTIVFENKSKTNGWAVKVYYGRNSETVFRTYNEEKEIYTDLSNFEANSMQRHKEWINFQDRQVTVMPDFVAVEPGKTFSDDFQIKSNEMFSKRVEFLIQRVCLIQKRIRIIFQTVKKSWPCCCMVAKPHAHFRR